MTATVCFAIALLEWAIKVQPKSSNASLMSRCGENSNPLVEWKMGMVHNTILYPIPLVLVVSSSANYLGLCPPARSINQGEYTGADHCLRIRAIVSTNLCSIKVDQDSPDDTVIKVATLLCIDNLSGASTAISYAAPGTDYNSSSRHRP